MLKFLVNSVLLLFHHFSEHKTETQINVIGLISSNPKTEIFVQFRGEEVLFFHLNFLENNEVEFVKTKSIGLSHFGFCQSLWDSQTRRLFIPGKVVSYTSRFRSGALENRSVSHSECEINR